MEVQITATKQTKHYSSSESSKENDVKSLTKESLRAKGFELSHIFSYDENYFYSKRYPVYRFKQNSTVILEVEISINPDTGEYRVNVFEGGTRDLYAPFYCRNEWVDNNDNQILNTVLKNVKKICNKLGLSEELEIQRYGKN